MDVGDVLAGRYELLDEIGVGGMGRVLRARDRTLGRVVAVKLLAPHLLGDQEAVAALRDEARRAAAVRHPNVVQVLDAVLQDTDQPAIVMEHVDGPALADVVPPGGMPVDDALAVVGAVGAGLAAVHEAGLVHRDVTPGNVLLDDGVPRLTDFGIARSAAATATQTVRGSVGYLAPEQASGERIGPAADVYALGCLATTLLTGRPPFDADTAVGIVHQHLHSAPPDLRERRPAVPAGVAAVIAETLAKAPEERPDSVAAVLGRLGLDTTAPLAATAGVGEATTVMPPRSETRQLDSTAASGPSRTLLAALAAVVVVAAAAGTVLLLADDRLPEVAASPSPGAAASPTAAPSPTAVPSPSPPTSSSPAPSPVPPRTAALASLQDLRALLVELRREDELSGAALEKLDEKAAAAAERLPEDDPNEAAKKLRELRRELGGLVGKDEVSRTAEDAVLSQLLEVEAALDDVARGNGHDEDGEGEGEGEGDGGDGDDDDDDDDD